MTSLTVARRACAVVLVGTLFGCAHKPTPLYMWETFPHQQYDVLMHEGASPDEQMHAMELHATKARSANAALPPGFRAHLGMLELNAGRADRAKELFEQEKAAFPESAPYMDRLLAKLATPAQTKKTDAPA
jgi:hypothetical protein